MRIPAPLLAAAAISAVVALVLGVVVAPADAIQGDAQRFMYLHVPAAWGAYLSFVVVVVASAVVLARGGAGTGLAWPVARAASEVGVVLTALTLLTGTVWGALTWGTWWAWDARVMATAAMGLVYLGHVALVSMADGRVARRVAAWVGIAGILTVPVVHFSVVWWRTLHQPPTILAPGTGTPIDATMGIALAAGMITMTLWAVAAVVARTRALLARDHAGMAAARRPVGPPEESSAGSDAAAVRR